MMAIKQAILVAASLLVAVPAVAQDAPAETFQEAEELTVSRAVLIFRLFASAVDSDDVAVENKDKLLSCLYVNDLKKISKATGAIVEANPQLDASDAGQLYQAAAFVCGVRRPEAASSDPAQAPAE